MTVLAAIVIFMAGYVAAFVTCRSIARRTGIPLSDPDRRLGSLGEVKRLAAPRGRTFQLRGGVPNWASAHEHGDRLEQQHRDWVAECDAVLASHERAAQRDDAIAVVLDRGTTGPIA